jgi:hypothetical protein
MRIKGQICNSLIFCHEDTKTQSYTKKYVVCILLNLVNLSALETLWQVSF